MNAIRSMPMTVLIGLVACAQAKPAVPTPTETPRPTFTETSTATQAPTATHTPSPTPDVRVIDDDPFEFLLTLDDVPAEARYYLPNSNWISPHRNSEIISGWGVQEGREYLEATGRIDGWWVVFKRGTSTVTAPEEIYDNVILYRDAAGALLVLEEYDITCDERERGYSIVSGRPTIGDASKACVRTEMQPSGRRKEWYTIEFAYRNVLHNMQGYGWEDEVEFEYVEAIALTLLGRLDRAPLSASVTFRP